MSEQRTYKAFIFDLDGTLLHTLPDLVNVTNKALADQGFPPHTPEEILTYVGDGAARLIAQAVPANATPEQAERVFQNFKNFYHDFGIIYTTEFDGITAALEQAKEAGVGLAILSNKFEQGVLDVRDRFFPDLIEVAHGESDTVPRKPDPTGCCFVPASSVLLPKNASSSEIQQATCKQPIMRHGSSCGEPGDTSHKNA